MASVVTPSCFRADPGRLHDRVRSLEQLCRRAIGRPVAPGRGVTLERRVVSSGLPSLDRLLPGGGIRQGSLIEWLEPAAESGLETAAGAAAFALAVAVRLQSAAGLPAGGPILVIDRGGRFYPPAVLPWLATAEPPAVPDRAVTGRWQRRGKGPAASPRNDRRKHGDAKHGDAKADRRLYVIRPDSEADEIWAIDQALRCPGVAAVVGWPRRVAPTPLRRWQLAAKASGVVGLLVRPAAARQQPTWAEVRVQVQPASHGQTAGGRSVAGWPAGRASWIDVRAYRLVRVGGGWEAATAVAEPTVDCLLDLNSGRECRRPAGASLQPDWSSSTNWKELACRAS